MSPSLGLLNIGTPELIIVVVVAIMLFGGDLPDVARKAARFVGKMRGMADDLSRELRQSEHAKGLDLSREVRDIDAAVRQAGARRDADGQPADGEGEVDEASSGEPAAGESDGGSTPPASARDWRPELTGIEPGRDPFADDPGAGTTPDAGAPDVAPADPADDAARGADPTPEGDPPAPEDPGPPIEDDPERDARA